MGESAIESHVECCTKADELLALIEFEPTALVTVRALPLASMFPPELLTLTASLRRTMACVVTTPAVMDEAGFGRCGLGDVIWFRDGEVAFRGSTTGAARRLSVADRQLTRRPRPADEAFDVLGVSGRTSLAEVRAARRRRLAACHPDRFQNASDDRRQFAEAEARRINAAFQTIGELTGWTDSHGPRTRR